MTPQPSSVAPALGRFAAEARWQDYPPALRHTAKRSLLNGVGTALGSAHDPAVEATARLGKSP